MGIRFSTTAEEALGDQDLSGKVAIVTGGYAGRGLETTRVLSKAGATVIVPARTAEKARANLAGIPRVEVGAIDLLDPGSIDAFAKAFLSGGRPLHLLINNAETMACPFSRDARGYESQFSANHLGHFQLTLRLWPALVKAGGARVVELSSMGHRFGDVDLDDPNFELRPYDKWRACGQSKTANTLFALGLDRRGAPHGVRAFAVHPGGIWTDLGRHLTQEDLDMFGVTLLPDGSIQQGPESRYRFKTIPQGVATTIWCAGSPRLNGTGGVYWEDCDIAAVTDGDFHQENGMAAYACDTERAERLWTLSVELTGVRRG